MAISGTECCNSCKNDSIIKMNPDKKRELDDYIDTLPLGGDVDKNRGFLIQCLHKAQGVFGYLPEELQLLVANRLGASPFGGFRGDKFLFIFYNCSTG